MYKMWTIQICYQHSAISTTEQIFIFMFYSKKGPHITKLTLRSWNQSNERATKLVPGLSTLSYPDRLKNLKLPTLTYCRARGDMIEGSKYLTECNKKSVTLLKLRAHPYTRGHPL